MCALSDAYRYLSDVLSLFVSEIVIAKPTGPSASGGRSAALASQAASGGSASTAPEKSAVIIVRALHNYAPRSSDELELRAGMNVPFKLCIYVCE